MADWDSTATVDLDDNPYKVPAENGYSSNGQHSRQSSRSSEMSSSNKENQNLDRRNSVRSEGTDNSSERSVILLKGSELKEESRTESVAFDNSLYANSEMTTTAPAPPRPSGGLMSWSGGTAKEKAAKSPHAPSTIESIPEEDIKIPNDANLSAFTPNQLANFLRCLKIDDRIISHLHRKSVDGKRFSKLRDSELDNLNMNNPVIVYFRDKSNVKTSKKKGPFML